MSQVQRFTILLSFMLTAIGLSAQDIHFTQYNMSPMTLNPANAGRFEGSVRIGGIYRDQWSSILSSNRFTTPSLWVDAPLFRGIRKQDWVGAGLMLFQDKAGAGGLRHSAIKIGASYHLALDQKRNNVLTLGVHYGGEKRDIDATKLTFFDSFDQNLMPTQTSGDAMLIATDDKNYTDWDAGVIFTSRLNKTTDMHLGFSMFHLFKPNYSLLANAGTGGATGPEGQRIPRRAIFHGQFNTQLSPKVVLSPSFLYQTMSGADEIVVQGMAGYLFNEEKDITLRFGAGYRLGDAAQVLLGAKIKSLNLGLAYDINMSDLSSVTNYRGGFELAANYIVRIYKAPVIVPKALCPRY